MAIFYADTSALVKRYQIETGSDAVNALYERIALREERILTSHFSLIEFGSAIMRLYREKIFSHEEAIGFLGLFRHESEKLLGFLPVTQSVLNESLRLVIEHSLKPPDALQLATALESRSFQSNLNNDFYFIVDDENLYQAALAEDIESIKPRDQNALEFITSLL